jgi:hypothetical protein
LVIPVRAISVLTSPVFFISDEYPPRGIKPWELYKDYRWVLALETEKLVNAMASGAVPVYYGDSRAARKVFKKGTFVDVLEIWRLKR